MGVGGEGRGKGGEGRGREGRRGEEGASGKEANGHTLEIIGVGAQESVKNIISFSVGKSPINILTIVSKKKRPNKKTRV
jgi:hypothetical protein